MDVGQRLAISVVKMATDLVQRVMLERTFHRRLHPARRADADGVGHTAMVHTDGLEQLDQVFDLVSADLALVGAAQRAGDGSPDLEPSLASGGDHRRKALDALFDAAVDVAPAEGLGGGTEHHHFVRAGGRTAGQRGLQAQHVGHQHAVANAWLARDRGHHLSVVGHLRHPFRADITGDLDLAQPGVLQPVHQLDLVRCSYRQRFVLQPIAWANFHQGDTFRNHGFAFQAGRLSRRDQSCSRSNSPPSATWSPTEYSNSATTPSRGAFSVCSIFIASITASAWPWLTRSPGLTR